MQNNVPHRVSIPASITKLPSRSIDAMTSRPDPNSVPFFVVGAQRSGTTMLRLMLNNHPRLAVPFESGFIPVFFKRLDAYGDLSKPGNAERLLEDIRRHPKVEKGGLVPDPTAVLAHSIAS